MKKAEIKIEGIEEVLSQLAKLEDIGEQEAFKAITASLYKVKRVALKKIQREEKTGAIYTHVFFRKGGKVIPYDLRSGGKGKYNLSATHQASAPGEPPATDTGSLVSSIRVKKTGRLEGTVGTDLKYGFWLEYGTKYIEARPWLSPSLEESRKYILDRFQKALQKAASQSGLDTNGS